MNSLQRFQQWIANTSPLFKLKPPFVTVKDIQTQALPDNEEYDGNPRLGFLYQYLCTKLLTCSPRYELVAEEIQLNDATGRTIGAVDLILKDVESNQHEHWEVAIKFYLLHQGVWYGTECSRPTAQKARTHAQPPAKNEPKGRVSSTTTAKQ